MKKRNNYKFPVTVSYFQFSLIATVVASSLSASAHAQDEAQAQSNARSTLPVITSLPSAQQSSRAGATSAQVPRQTKAIPTEKGAFENYAEKVTGKKLDIFGANLFTDVPTTFSPMNTGQVNPDYIIGSGDELQVRGWGMVDIDISATVDRSGSIYIPRVGSVKVAGVAYRDLQGYLKKAVSRFFNNFELTASIAQTRAVQVYVVGHAVRPGTYTLSAMSTLLNALFESGGPSTTGSMRNIQVKRGAEIVTSFDLYDMLSKGDKSSDATLRDGDVIYIPEVGPLVALIGNVKKPSIFELKSEATLADIIDLAGGFDSAAQTKRVVIEKSVNNSFQIVTDIIANSDAATTALNALPVKPTEVYRVFSPEAIPVQAQVQQQYVQVSGEFQRTGVFAITKGETLRQLVNRLGGAATDGYLYAMQLHRESVRQSQQAKLDEIAERFERDLESNASLRIAGTADQGNIAVLTAELERQRALAKKLRGIKAEGKVVLELKDANVQVKDLPDLPLHDGDTIYLPRKPGTVHVLGAVFQQNTFIYKPNQTVEKYLTLAGGATASSDTSETYVIRADGTALSKRDSSWFGGFSGSILNPGDTVVVPEKIARESWTQNLKEWTSIFYQFGLGAAGLKVLKD